MTDGSSIEVARGQQYESNRDTVVILCCNGARQCRALRWKLTIYKAWSAAQILRRNTVDVPENGAGGGRTDIRDDDQVRREREKEDEILYQSSDESLPVSYPTAKVLR